MRIGIHVGKRHPIEDQRLQRTARALLTGIGNAHVTVNPSMLESFDILHAHDLDALPATLLHKAMTNRKTKVVYDAHEDWSVYRKPYVRWAEAMMLPFVDAAISPSPAITERLAKTVKVTQTILNCPELPPPPTEPKYEQFTVAYVGHIGSGRGYPQLIEAARTLKQQGVDIHYLLMGKGTIDIPSDIVAQFEVTGQLPHGVMMKRLQRCHLGLILFEDTPNHRIALPHKLFEYMAAGIPVLATNCCHEVAKIINQEQCGILHDYSRGGLADAISWMWGTALAVHDFGHMGLAASKNGYNAPVQGAKLTHLYGRLV